MDEGKNCSGKRGNGGNCMKNVFLVYDNCCFYEIVILNYFMSFTGEEMVFCSPEGNAIRAAEGYFVHVDMPLTEIDEKDIKCLIITGGDISRINNADVHAFIRRLQERNVLIGAICAGVDVLHAAGVLEGITSTHTADLDIANDKKIITARANAYVDFAIEAAKELDLFEDEADLKETIDFWKYHKRVQ